MAQRNITRKDAAIQNTGDADEFPGGFEVILSAPTKDRDGDTLTPDGWELPLPDHITFDQDHGMTVATTVGSGTPRIDEETGNLIVSGTYSSLPRAQEVRTLVNEGHIKTTSVAFMNKKVAKANGDGYRTVRELLNGAFVAIPSNREALVLSSKAGARNSKTDAAHIQTVHDAALALGAVCDAGAKHVGPDDVEAKALAGSLEATRERVADAVQDAYPGQFTYVRGTLPDSVVFNVEDPETYDMDTFQQTYTDDGVTVTLTGTATPVSLQEVVGPADDDEQTESEPATAPDESAPTALAATGAETKGATAHAEGSPNEDEALALQAMKTAYAARTRLAL